jgi:Uma2 family endonuclease
MSVTLPPPELPATPSRRKRWSRDDCAFLENAGLLKIRYELLDGEIVVKMGQNPPHAISVMRVIAYCLPLFGPLCVRTQATLEVAPGDLPTNRPEPDIVILREEASAITSRPPRGDDARLVVEVCDTTQGDDFGFKVGLYARAGVAEYWVLDLARRQLTIFSNSDGTGWQGRQEYAETATVAPAAAPTAPVVVGNLLP